MNKIVADTEKEWVRQALLQLLDEVDKSDGISSVGPLSQSSEKSLYAQSLVTKWELKFSTFVKRDA